MTVLVVVLAGAVIAVALSRSDTTNTAAVSTDLGRTVPTDDSSAPPAAVAPPVSEPTEIEPLPVVEDTVAPAPAPVGDVRSEPSGLFCKDLKAKGYSYSAAVDYWRLNGQANSMDADKNGIPCETVYPRSDITAYWPSSTYEAIPSYGLPSGLFCKDLRARGIDVYGALEYYIWEGSPSRMDADGNGIPCETVYPDAPSVWFYEF